MRRMGGNKKGRNKYVASSGAHVAAAEVRNRAAATADCTAATATGTSWVLRRHCAHACVGLTGQPPCLSPNHAQQQRRRQLEDAQRLCSLLEIFPGVGPVVADLQSRGSYSLFVAQVRRRWPPRIPARPLIPHRTPC